MKKLTPGETVRLRGPGFARRITGQVRASWEEDGSTRIRLYEYATREERVYTVDRRGIARRPVSGQGAADGTSTGAAPVEEPGHPGADDRVSRFRGILRAAIRLLASAALVAMAVALVTPWVMELRVSRMSYEDFLETELTPARLVRLLAARVSYERDVEDYWSPARGVWSMRRGDCEDYAMVVSAYLTRHGVEHEVVSFALKESLAGHAAVVAEVEDARVLIDPTMATAPGGLRVYRAGENGGLPSTAEALAPYAVLPAATYETPPEPGRPAVTGSVGE